MRFLLITLIMSLAPASFAQSAPEGDANPDDGLEIFDQDVDLTPLGWEQFSVSAGYMSLTADGRYTLRFPDGKEVSVLNLDRLGLDERDSSHWIAMTYRSATSRWGAWFGAWQYDVAGYRVWKDELRIDDELVIPVGAGVVTELVADWYILEATYSFVRNRTVDFGVGFGVHAVELDTTFAGRYELGDKEDQFIRKDISTLAPLPNLVGYVYWNFAPKWKLLSRYGWFGLSYAEYRGQMTNMHAMLRYQLSKRWDLETGYQFVRLDLDIAEDSLTQVYDIDFKGPLAALRFKF